MLCASMSRGDKRSTPSSQPTERTHADDKDAAARDAASVSAFVGTSYVARDSLGAAASVCVVRAIDLRFRMRRTHAPKRLLTNSSAFVTVRAAGYAAARLRGCARVREAFP